MYNNTLHKNYSGVNYQLLTITNSRKAVLIVAHYIPGIKLTPFVKSIRIKCAKLSTPKSLSCK